jgi:choline-glycine betaine transporter
VCPKSHADEARKSRKVLKYARRSKKGRRKGLNEVTEQEQARKEAARALLGTVSCIVGILCGAFGILFAILGASNNVSAGAIGAALGILGYFLGQRRLAVAAIVIGVITVFFMAAASTGLIPGVPPLGHGYN